MVLGSKGGRCVPITNIVVIVSCSHRLWLLRVGSGVALTIRTQVGNGIAIANSGAFCCSCM